MRKQPIKKKTIADVKRFTAHDICVAIEQDTCFPDYFEAGFEKKKKSFRLMRDLCERIQTKKWFSKDGLQPLDDLADSERTIYYENEVEIKAVLLRLKNENLLAHAKAKMQKRVFFYSLKTQTHI